MGSNMWAALGAIGIVICFIVLIIVCIIKVFMITVIVVLRLKYSKKELCQLHDSLYNKGQEEFLSTKIRFIKDLEKLLSDYKNHPLKLIMYLHTSSSVLYFTESKKRKIRDILYWEKLSTMPLFINDGDNDIRHISKWRMQIGK